MKTKLKVDRVVVHEVDEYYTLPEGGRFMNRNGMPDVWEYRVIEHVSFRHFLGTGSICSDYLGYGLQVFRYCISGGLIFGFVAHVVLRFLIL